MTLNEMRGMNYLSELQEAVESLEPKDSDYDRVLQERGKIVQDMIDGTTLSKSLLSNGVTTLGYSKSPRVTRVYFSDVSDVQAAAYSLRKDKTSNEWYLNTWAAGVKVTELDTYIQSKGIPFTMSKFRMFGGK